MLSRVADALYWMSRYMERAEHAARVLEVTRGFLIDLEELDAETAEAQWDATFGALALTTRKLEDAVFSEGEPASLLSCVSRSRENGRQVREVISSEMWEHLNQAYWGIKEAHGRAGRVEELSQTLEHVVNSSFLWAGVTDATMSRGEGWHFIKLGQFVERADRISRIVSMRSRSQPTSRPRSSQDNVLWLMTLRSCSALEAFRKVYPTRVDPDHIVDFLVFDQEFPRTVRHSVKAAARYAERLPKGERAAKVQRAFGRLAARLDYAEIDEIIEAGPHDFLDELVADLSKSSMALQQTYFLH